MFPDLLADENVDARIIDKLREAGFSVLSVGERFSGISDRKILELARTNGSIVITEDKDFGELVFSHKASGVGVIFLRYHVSERASVTESIVRVIRKLGISLRNKFTVITATKIRAREI